MISPRSFNAIFIGLIGLFLFPAAALAQEAQGVIVGIVQDKTRAVVPGVEVTVTDVGQARSRVTITGDAGNYRVGNLDPGEYEIRASLVGFETTVLTGIVLQVGQIARIPITLSVGEVSQELTVESVSPIIQTDHATVGEVIDTTKVTELPLNGRDFYQLATLTPGVVANTQDQVGVFAHTGTSISANGIGPQSTNVMVDGIQNVEFGAGRLAFTPSIDLIQEFQIVTNVYDAEFGGTPAAQINMATKRGSLDYHGSLFYFRRSDALDARNFFETGALPPFEREQFGGSLGGHVPGSEKDFFFFVYEGQRQARGLTLRASVPPVALRNGDFGEFGTTIYDPMTTDPATGERQPFPNNVIPANRITPQAAYISSLWPEPTLPGTVANFVANPDRLRNFDQWSIRYDRDLTDADSIMVRFTRNKNSYLEPQPRAFTLPVNGFRQNQTFVGPNWKAGWTRTISPTTLNSFNIGYSKFDQCRDSEATDPELFGCGGPHGPLTGPEFFENSGIQGVSPEAQRADIPRIRVSGWNDIATSTFAPVASKEPHYQINNVFSKVEGNHSWKAGVDILDSFFELNFEARTRGRIDFASRFTTASVGSPGNEFHSFADFLLGQVNFSNLFGNALFQEIELTWWSFFIQDDWSVHPDVTLNLGLRYEIFQRPVERGNRVVAFDLATEQFVFPGSVPNLPGTPPNSVTADSLGYSRTLQHDTDRNDYGPRLGFAWRIGGDNSTVLRGGFGVFYTWFVEDMQVGQGFGPPFVPQASNRSDPDRPAATFEAPFAGSAAATVRPSGVAVKDNNTGYLYQYSLGLDRALTPTLGFEISIVGNAARKMLRSHNYNQAIPGPAPISERVPFPQYGSLTARQSWANGSYSGPQMKLRKDFSGGLMGLVSYTWGRAIGHVVPGAAFRQQPNRNHNNWKADYGPTQWDIPQILSLSWVWDLPVGRGKPVGKDLTGVANAIFGGWKFGGIANFQAGNKFTVGDIFNNSNAGGSRPDMISNPNGVSHGSNASKIAQFFKTSAFVRAPRYTFGNTGVGVVSGPGLGIWDLSLYKDIHVGEGMRAQFRVEFFNAFNKANFFNPNGAFGSSSFGVISRTRDARQIQWGLRFDF